MIPHGIIGSSVTVLMLTLWFKRANVHCAILGVDTQESLIFPDITYFAGEWRVLRGNRHQSH